MKRYDIYISNTNPLVIKPLSALGVLLHDHLKWKCLEAGVTIDEVNLADRRRLVNSIRRGGYSVTSKESK